MGNYIEIRQEIEQSQASDVLQKYLNKLSLHTKRNVIAYYSGWLYRSNCEYQINDKDMNAFMTALHKVDFKKGLDLILHTPGGGIEATESIIKYLRTKFDHNIRVIVPHLAMSAGTMIALSSKQIIMGEHSSLGPVDPFIGDYSTHDIMIEFKEACEQVKKNPSIAALWQVLLNKLPPTILAKSEKVIKMTEEIVKELLTENMLKDKDEKQIKQTLEYLTDPKHTKQHGRHINISKAKKYGLFVNRLEDDPDLQDLVCSLHHTMTYVFEHTQVYKVVLSDNGQNSVLSIPISTPNKKVKKT